MICVCKDARREVKHWSRVEWFFHLYQTDPSPLPSLLPKQFTLGFVCLPLMLLLLLWWLLLLLQELNMVKGAVTRRQRSKQQKHLKLKCHFILFLFLVFRFFCIFVISFCRFWWGFCSVQASWCLVWFCSDCTVFPLWCSLIENEGTLQGWVSRNSNNGRLNGF